MIEEKAKIYLKPGIIMDEFAFRHLKELYGLNPDVLPFAFQFPRVPPGLPNPIGVLNNSPKNQFKRKGDNLGPNLQDFKEMYQKFAVGLIDFKESLFIPPGHPLYSRENSVESLKMKNNKLKKDNLELKKNLDNISKDKSDDHHV